MLLPERPRAERVSRKEGRREGFLVFARSGKIRTEN